VAKILTDRELVEIITRAVNEDDLIDSWETYENFLKDLGGLVCKYFGGEVGTVDEGDAYLGWTVAIRINEDVPFDGGVLSGYDTDVKWENGEEVDA
jgi:hypothetical protein